MRLDVKKAREIVQAYDELNNLDVKDVEFYEDGVKLDIDPKIIDDWRFVGLGLAWFIGTEFYKTGWVEGEIS